jgi:hypothetical protein
VFEAVYQFWKVHKRGLMKREEASTRIRRWLPTFFLIYPFFKLAKPFVKIHLSFRRGIAT